MIDLRIIAVQDVLPVTGIERLADFNPPTLRLRGEDFNSVADVTINGTMSPDVIAETNKSLLVQIPENVAGQLLRSITVTSTKFTKTTRRSLINFGFNPSRPGVAGLERLVQLFLKVMLQSPNTYSNLGGGMLKALGASHNAASLTADLQLAVGRARSQIIAQQAASPAIPLDEQLKDARLLHSEYNSAKLALTGTIAVDNRNGKSSVVGLGL